VLIVCEITFPFPAEYPLTPVVPDAVHEKVVPDCVELSEIVAVVPEQTVLVAEVITTSGKGFTVTV